MPLHGKGYSMKVKKTDPKKKSTRAESASVYGKRYKGKNAKMAIAVGMSTTDRGAAARKETKDRRETNQYKQGTSARKNLKKM